jgi:structural maintenance of chromosome 3 (chondroitin sulfate proteoglycan 6)
MTAIEVTAGNALFHVVVDTDETASKLLEVLNKQKAGRLTFIPLNKLEVKEPSYPSTTTVKPITEYMQFNRVHDKAFMQIFGKTLLASNLESASNVARMHKMNCVTLEGDQINAKGALTGGYHDARTSRLRATRDLKQLKQQLQQLQDKHQKTKSTGAGSFCCRLPLHVINI